MTMDLCCAYAVLPPSSFLPCLDPSLPAKEYYTLHIPIHIHLASKPIAFPFPFHFHSNTPAMTMSLPPRVSSLVSLRTYPNAQFQPTPPHADRPNFPPCLARFMTSQVNLP